MAWIWVAAAVVFVLVLLVVFFAGKSLQLKRTKEVLDKFRGKKVYGVTSDANYFGRESEGRMQMRGNGVLVFTPEELYFEMWLPQEELRIPLSSITGVETPMRHLGKSKGRRLLKVHFRNEKGEKDSAAWIVNRLEKWKKALTDISS
ncbi:MAG: hypothetical protein MJA29_08600 [Candidatus Omnitrophica bacterium]|nr:hypothetical protein [Candidatus Omnitrophota bacterium]